MGKLIGTFTPGSPAWHDARRGRIGSSDIPAIVGLSPFQSRYSLWMEKAGIVTRAPGNAATERGHYLEDAVAQWWADKNDCAVRPTGTWEHDVYPQMIANPDRLIYTGPRGRKPRGILEVKTSTGPDWGPDGSDEVPPYVACQVQWQMEVCGFPSVTVALLDSYLTLKTYQIRRDRSQGEWLVSRAVEFLRSIDKGEEPEIDASNATYTAIRRRHPDIDGTEVDIRPDLAQWFITAHRLLGGAQADYNDARSHVAAEMGNARVANYIVNDGSAWERRRLATRRAKNGAGTTPYLVPERRYVLSEETK